MKRTSLVLTLLVLGGCEMPPVELAGPGNDVELTRQEFIVIPGPRPFLLKNVKPPGIIQIGLEPSTDLPPHGPARDAVKESLRNAVLEWLKPMRVQSPEVTRTVKVTACWDRDDPASNPPEGVDTDCGKWSRVRVCLPDDPGDCSFELVFKRARTILSVYVEPRTNATNGGRSVYLLDGNDNLEGKRYDAPAIVFHTGQENNFPVVLHEIGHAFGLGDTYVEADAFQCDAEHRLFPPTQFSVMCNASFNALQADDIAGINHLFCNEFRPPSCPEQ
jgi:hypothetical protein